MGDLQGVPQLPWNRLKHQKPRKVVMYQKNFTFDTNPIEVKMRSICFKTTGHSNMIKSKEPTASKRDIHICCEWFRRKVNTVKILLARETSNVSTGALSECYFQISRLQLPSLRTLSQEFSFLAAVSFVGFRHLSSMCLKRPKSNSQCQPTVKPVNA